MLAWQVTSTHASCLNLAPGPQAVGKGLQRRRCQLPVAIRRGIRGKAQQVVEPPRHLEITPTGIGMA